MLASSSLPALEARILLAHVLRSDRAWLAAHPEAVPEAHDAASFAALCERRGEGEPIAYLVGEREFYGLRLRVTPAVLIPRPETELLVELTLARTPRDVPARVLDLGTGSGAIALAVAHARANAHVLAIDASAEALEVARSNARRLACGNVTFCESTWFSDVPRERFDLIVSNPPYVAEDDPHLGQGDLRFEPRGALAAGRDGLDALRVITRDAPQFLAVGGTLVVEHGYDQAEACRALFERAGLSAIETHEDLAGIPRVTLGRRV